MKHCIKINRIIIVQESSRRNDNTGFEIMVTFSNSFIDLIKYMKYYAYIDVYCMCYRKMSVPVIIPSWAHRHHRMMEYLN